MIFQDMKKFEAWAEGRTGVPFVDANMRELKHTGWMSNRGRQNVASFLVKDLGLDWRLGGSGSSLSCWIMMSALTMATGIMRPVRSRFQLCCQINEICFRHWQ